MIDVKELGIGNYVYWNKEYYQIDIDHLRFYLVFEPIPLTPDILGKCKQATKKTIYQGTAYRLDVGDFDLSFGFLKASKEWVEFKILGNGGYDDGGEMDITKTCQYLHQLQNLFFSLTNTDLEFIH